MNVRRTSASSAHPPQRQALASSASSAPADQKAPISPITPPEVFDSRVVQPELGREYQANQSLPRDITLSFDERAIAFFENSGLKIDLEEAQIVTQDGRRMPLDHRATSLQDPRENYAVESGFKLAPEAEPWQFRVPGIPSQVFGKPHGVHIVGADSGLSLQFVDSTGHIIARETAHEDFDDFQGMRVQTKVFRRNRQSTLGQLASHRPSSSQPGPANLPHVDRSIPNVTFRSPTQVGLDTARSAFEKLLGSLVRQRTESFDLKKFEVYERQVQQIIEEELKGGGDVDGFAAMQKAMHFPIACHAMEELHGPGAEHLAKDELLDRVAQKMMKACPLEIVVIPRGKTALDCVEVERESTKQQLERAGRAYFLRSNPFAYRSETGSKDLPTQRLFVGEEIIETEQGVKAVLMHELLHVYEHLYATPEETQEIEKSFHQASEFQSLYGANRDEYLTTLGEEFLGTHGPDGPEWVKTHHRPVYDLLQTLVSTDETTTG